MILTQFTFEPFLIDSRIFRKGLLLHLKGSNGKESTVEISPLPGYSKETFGDAKEQLQQIQRRMMTSWWSEKTLDSLGRMELSPSVHFALETGILDLLDPIEDEKSVKTYSLVFGTPEEILSCAEEIEQEGQTQIKVKLGHLTPPVAHEVIDSLKNRFQLRLDFNRKWTKEQTTSFCDQYPEDQFLYMEEPCQNPEDLFHFPYPFALDETLRTPLAQKLYPSAMLKALILKPTLSYPISPYLKTGVPCVITSSFESRVGIGQLRRLIKRLQLENTHHGLDTLRFFETHDEMSHRLPATASR